MNILSKGTLLGGRWRIDSLIGEGACAKVYTVSVSDSLPGVNLVAKVIPKGTGKGKKQKDQDRLCDTLHYEYLLYTGSLMQFPYLPQRPDNFYGTDDSVGVRYLVMERLETDLHSLSTRPQKLTPLEVATWGIQILSGLQFMHNIGFIFVDVKPENFMIKGKDLYFIDFGLVERVDLKASVAGSRTPVGTPTYKGLAAQKGNTPSKRDDVEALGYVLLSMASGGTLPWAQATSEAQLLAMKESCDIKSLCKANNCDEVAEIILECRNAGPLKAADYDRFKSLLEEMKVRVPSVAIKSQQPAHKKARKEAAEVRPSSDEDCSGGIPLPAEDSSTKASQSQLKDKPRKAVPARKKTEAAGSLARKESDEGPFASSNSSLNEENLPPKTPVLLAEEGLGVGAGAEGLAAPEDKILTRRSTHARSAKLASSSITALSTARNKRDNKAPVPAPIPVPSSSYSSADSSSGSGGEGQFSLRLLAGPVKDKMLHFRLDSTEKRARTLGRNPACDFHIPNDFISECHADIKVEDQRLLFFDNASSNGTKINDVTVKPKKWIELNHGDVIRLGQCQLVVVKS